MSESTNLERITLDSVQQADAKLLYSDDDFVVMNDFKDISTFRGAHVSSYVIIFCKKGKISFTYNHNEDHITTGECFVFVPGSIITDIMMSLEFEGIGVFLTQRLLQGLLHNDINIWNKILYVEKQNKFVAFKSHGENIPDYGKYWKIAAENRNRPFAKQITLSIIHTFLLEMCSIFVDNEEKRGDQVCPRGSYHGEAEPSDLPTFHSYPATGEGQAPSCSLLRRITEHFFKIPDDHRQERKWENCEELDLRGG